MNRLCSRCGSVVRGPCTTCRTVATQRRSPTVGDYGRRWRAGPRRRQLAREPVCQWVEGGTRCTARASDVDHIIRRRDGGTDAASNLQSLCHRHHSVKTAREVNASRTRRGARAAA